MVKSLLLCLILVLGSSKDKAYHCDMLELNHFYDLDSNHIFDQVILWKWYDPECEYHVSEYYMLNLDMSAEINKKPQKNYSSGLYEAWRGVDKIIAPNFRESWTQTDPERNDKHKLDERLRIRTIPSPDSPQWRQNENGEWIVTSPRNIIIIAPQ
jgi:hypothetical protein